VKGNSEKTPNGTSMVWLTEARRQEKNRYKCRNSLSMYIQSNPMSGGEKAEMDLKKRYTLGLIQGRLDQGRKRTRMCMRAQKKEKEGK
jgi:hypothetical protein